MEFHYYLDETDMARYSFFMKDRQRKSWISRIMAFFFSFLFLFMFLMVTEIYTHFQDGSTPGGVIIPFFILLTGIITFLGFMTYAIGYKIISIWWLKRKIRKKGDPYGLFGRNTMRINEDCYGFASSKMDQFISWTLVKKASIFKDLLIIEHTNGTVSIVPGGSIEEDLTIDRVESAILKELKRSRDTSSRNTKDGTPMNKGSSRGEIMDFTIELDEIDIEDRVPDIYLDRLDLTKVRVILLILSIISLTLGYLLVKDVFFPEGRDVATSLESIAYGAMSFTLGVFLLLYSVFFKRFIRKVLKKVIGKWRITEDLKQHYSIHDWGLRKRNDIMDVSYSWEVINGVEDMEDMILINLPAKEMYVVPKRCLNEEEINMILYLIDHYSNEIKSITW